MKYPKTIIVSIVLISTVVMIAHLLGYKIYGSPAIVNNQPLKNPQTITGTGAQGTISLKNGKEYKVYGITIISPNKFEKIRYLYSKKELEIHEFPYGIHEIPFKVEMESPDRHESKIWYKEQEMSYWCGLMLYPRWFPPRLQGYVKRDLGTTLVANGAAIPDASLFEKDPEYARELMKSLSFSVSHLSIEQNPRAALELGEYLAESRPEYLREGAWLLTHFGKAEIFDKVSERFPHLVKKYETLNETPSDSKWDTKREIGDFASILLKLSPDRAVPFLLDHIQSRADVEVRLRLANVLLSAEDPAGYDVLMDEMIDPDTDKTIRAVLLAEMDEYFYNKNKQDPNFPPTDARKLYDWFRKNKKSLQPHEPETPIGYM